MKALLSHQREANHPRTPPYLASGPLNGVVGADAPPVLHEEPRAGQCLGGVLAHTFERCCQPPSLHRRCHRINLLHADIERLLSVNHLEHGCHPPLFFRLRALESTFAAEAHSTPLLGDV